MTIENTNDVGATKRGRSGPAVSRRLRVLLYVVLGLVAVTGANSIYLAGITFLEWTSANWGEELVYENQFYVIMFMGHLVIGLVLIVPFLVFGAAHWRAARWKPNRRAAQIGYALLATAVVLLVSGLLLVRIEGVFELKHPRARQLTYWIHVISPLVVVWLYWIHRLSGPRIRWKIGLGYAGATAVFVALMIVFQTQDPRQWGRHVTLEAERPYEPSLVRTRHSRTIPARSLMMDEYCRRCHEDIHTGWYHSVHRFSSFNNPAYLASVRETRETLIARDGNDRAVRWCAGCHDPVPLLSGAFDRPDFDELTDPTATAGITCSVCHGITHVNSVRGNGDYTIEQPLHYPFAYSTHPVLQFINETLVKAKPSFHKQTFLKPLHRTPEFCSVCHKVHLPKEVTAYKEFLRGQNHYDSYLLSGVSGHGARSFYYPERAEENCNECHMPWRRSDDFGAKQVAGKAGLQVHDHLFPSANTAIAWLRNEPEVVAAHQEFLQGIVRLDIFAIKEGGTIDGPLRGPLRPEMPSLEPGKRYLLEIVIRTLKMGHHLTQGTTDSNQLWLDLRVSAGERLIGRSGSMNDDGRVDPWAHFVNVFMLDRNGYRIARRNAADIFVPLYDHQIPPGAAQTVHYALDVPPDVREPITVEATLKYRKFDATYMDFVAEKMNEMGRPLQGRQSGEFYVNELPVTVMARDTVTLPVVGSESDVPGQQSDIPLWQRWNDYGIGLFLKGKAELRQAADAFSEVERLGRYDGPLNLARVYYREGRLDEAVEAVQRAAACSDPPAPSWTLGWLSGLLNREQGHLIEAEQNFSGVLATRIPDRKFDFSLDLEVSNLLGQTLFDQAIREMGPRRRDARDRLLRRAIAQFQQTLQIDPENVTAHYNLARLYDRLGEDRPSDEHARLHQRYKPDENARDRAVALARARYPAANRAAEAVVIYELRPHEPWEPNVDERETTADWRNGSGTGGEEEGS